MGKFCKVGREIEAFGSIKSVIGVYIVYTGGIHVTLCGDSLSNGLQRGLGDLRIRKLSLFFFFFFFRFFFFIFFIFFFFFRFVLFFFVFFRPVLMIYDENKFQMFVKMALS